jgi:hypothetical protein
MDGAEKRALFKDEYLQLQKVIEDFDGRIVRIKAWSVTFSLVTLAGAFASYRAEVLLVASFSAFLFWLIEGYWKLFQLAYYERSEKIEDYFADYIHDIVPMQIGRSWDRAFKSKDRRRLFRSTMKDGRRRWPIMFWNWVALPHAFVVLAGVLLYMLDWWWSILSG